MKKNNKFIILFLSIILISFVGIEIIKNNNITANINNHMAQQSSKIIYIVEGDESSTTGNGTESNPYQSIEYAVKKANDGDTIKLLENIGYRQPAANVNFIIDKNITIDGGNYTLSFRGSNLELLANVEFKNITLNMIPDGSGTTKIYVSGNEVTFNNVSTLISQAQTNERPTIIGGSASGSPSGAHTKINILNGSSETRFKEIIAGKENADSSLPVTINISSEYSKVDNGINLGGISNHKVTGEVSLTTNSKNIKKINGTNSTNDTVTITDSTIYNIELTNIKNLNLKNNAEITPTNFSSLDGDLNLSNGTALWLNTIGQVPINNLKGTGDLIISTDTNIIIKGDIVDASNIKLNGFESDLVSNLNKIYIEVTGTINSKTKVSLYNENEYYLINKEGNKYRLIENNNFDKENIKKIEVIQNPNKLSYIVGDTIDINGLILKLTDINDNSIIVDYTNLNDYNITYTPNTKLTINDKIITIQNKTIKATISIVITEKVTRKTDSEIYTPTIENKTIKSDERLKASEFITNKTKLPKDTKYAFEKEPDFKKIGTQEVKVIITYKDNSKDTISATLTIEETKQEEQESPEIEHLQPEEQAPQDEEKKEDNEIVNKEELTIKGQNINQKEQKDSKSNIIYIIFIFIIILLIGVIIVSKFIKNKKKNIV